MSLLDILKAFVSAAGSLMPWGRREYKHEIEIRRADSPPCHQRELRVRHPWMIWHTRVFVSHVDNTGKVSFQVIR
jgi:hypothetical protein